MVLVDVLCVAILFHLHVVAKLVFATFFKLTTWRTKVVPALLGLLCAMSFLELFVICGFPEDLLELASLRCREPMSIAVEYAAVFLFAAADFLRDSDYFAKAAPKNPRTPRKQRTDRKSFRKAFIALLTFSWLLYLSETDRDLLDVASVFESIPKPWQPRAPLHPSSKRVREKRRKAA